MPIPAGTKFIGIGSDVPTPENKSSQNNAFQEVYTIDEIITEAQVGVTPLPSVVVIDIEPSEIYSAHTTEIELLPALGGNKYDVVDEVLVEYIHKTTPYSISASGFIKIFRSSDSISNGPIKWIYGSMLTASENNLVIPETSTITNTIGFPQQTNNSQTLSIIQSALVLKLTHAATLGDGILRVTVTYRSKSFGS